MPYLVKYPQDVLNIAQEFSHIVDRRVGRAFDKFNSFYHWYYIPNGDIFAPAKFLGYEGTTLENYTSEDHYGGKATDALEKWFAKVQRGTPDHDALRTKLNRFAASIEKTIPRRTFEGDGAIYFPLKEYNEYFNPAGLSCAIEGQPDSLGHNVAPTPRAADFEEPEGPDRFPSHGYRILRDTATASAIKELHHHRCQVCSRAALELADGRPYAEAHHLKPLGSPHGGPDVAGNIICVCPNCHALLDYFAIPLYLFKLGSAAGHRVEREYIEYHNNSHSEVKARVS